ncbi:DUF3244 domain-containing protein [Parabacteroides sp. OttesenSCG-928-G07]|nr:DUF3244 domain-containing protein [Parabacteroides sp. OttesenSCG-928-G21]MDL2277488.1 DUF3244 domain-containing protein [Parabacteroides sp. OttesenSCG-928-G07]
MKNLFIKTMLLFSFFLVTSSVWADRIVTEGQWDGKRKRILVPAKPTANIEGNVLSIFFEEAFANLYVCVTDSEGNIVYANYISAPSNNYTYDNIVLTLSQGETYRIELSHVTYGLLVGTFTY